MTDNRTDTYLRVWVSDNTPLSPHTGYTLGRIREEETPDQAAERLTARIRNRTAAWRKVSELHEVGVEVGWQIIDAREAMIEMGVDTQTEMGDVDELA